MSPDQQPYVVTKPGGLSSAAHAVHVLICLLTCGLWIPGYLLFVLAAPKQRREVVTAYGQPVPYVEGAGMPRPLPPHMNPPQTPEQVRASNRRIVLVFVAIGAGIAVLIGVGLVVSVLTG